MRGTRFAAFPEDNFVRFTCDMFCHKSKFYYIQGLTGSY